MSNASHFTGKQSLAIACCLLICTFANAQSAPPVVVPESITEPVKVNSTLPTTNIGLVPSTFNTDTNQTKAADSPAVVNSPSDTLAGPGPRGKDYPNKDISIFFGGRVQLDAVEYILPHSLRDNIPGTSPLLPGVSFRRLRFDVSGSFYQHTDYLIQVDFVNGLRLGPGGPQSTDVVVPTDAWLAFKDLPIVGNIKIGNQKPLYSFEHMVSSRYLNFMERSLGYDAFVEGFNNGFQPGITAYDTYLDKHGTWAVGVFKNTRSAFGFNVGNNETEVNGRVTYLPVYECEGSQLVHLGLGTSARDMDNDQTRFRARFDARNSPSGLSALAADTGLINASSQLMAIPELVAVWGPWSMQSEYYASWVNGVTADANGNRVPPGSAFLSSWYVEGHLFLTGEHMNYNRNSGVFGGVKPLHPVEWTRDGFTGWGAWQLLARFSALDLNGKQLQGGRVNDYSVGVNWFLNPFLKFQSNIFMTERHATSPAATGTIYGFAARMAMDF